VLCCAVLCCAVLCCAVLCCAVLCCAVLCCLRYQAETAAGGSEVKEHLLDESTDELWAELRHSHIAGQQAC